MTEIATTFPLLGRVCRVDYGQFTAVHDFRTPDVLVWSVSEGEPASGRAAATYTPIRDDLWVVAFDEPPAFGVIVEDLTARTATSLIKLPGQPVLRASGSLELIG